MKKTFLLIVLLWVSSLAIAQNVYQKDINLLNQKRQKINKVGMLTLGTWALGNITTAGFGLSNSTGSQKHFHQMNMGWGLVNLTLAGFAYYSNANMADNLSLAESVNEHYKIQKILLFNSGLDVAYIATGLFLKEKAKNDTKRPEMFEGFGNSLILQGSFLLAFDITLYLAHRSQNLPLKKILEHVQVQPQGLGFIYQF